jgi:amidohydrolase
MIKEGVLENPKPASVIGMHVMPQIDAGKVGFRKGLYMASTDEIYVTITAKGGHGAMPPPYHRSGIDRIKHDRITSADCQPKCKTFCAFVFIFGKFIANGATNVFLIQFTRRHFQNLDEEWRMKRHKKISTWLKAL